MTEHKHEHVAEPVAPGTTTETESQVVPGTAVPEDDPGDNPPTIPPDTGG